MLKSFRHAARGVATLIATQSNARIHLGTTFAVALLGLGLGLSPNDWCWLVIAGALVWTAEALNTAVELLGDAASRGHDPLIGRAKDVAAGGVLLAAMGAALIGVIILLPRLLTTTFGDRVR